MPSQLSQSTREEVLKAYGRECIFCETHEAEHKEEHGRSLDIHHLVPERAGGSDDSENLVPLCISCHRTMESAHGKAMKELAKAKGHDRPTREEYNKLQKELKNERAAAEKDDEMVDHALNDQRFLADFFREGEVRVNVHVVHESRFDTSRLLYVGSDLEKAKEAYEMAEYNATLEMASVTGSLKDSLFKADWSRLVDRGHWFIDGLRDLVGPSLDELERGSNTDE